MPVYFHLGFPANITLTLRRSDFLKIKILKLKSNIIGFLLIVKDMAIAFMNNDNQIYPPPSSPGCADFTVRAAVRIDGTASYPSFASAPQLDIMVSEFFYEKSEQLK